MPKGFEKFEKVKESDNPLVDNGIAFGTSNRKRAGEFTAAALTDDKGRYKESKGVYATAPELLEAGEIEQSTGEQIKIFFGAMRAGGNTRPAMNSIVRQWKVTDADNSIVPSPHNYHEFVDDYVNYGLLFELQLLDELTELVELNWKKVQFLFKKLGNETDDTLANLEMSMSGDPLVWKNKRKDSTPPYTPDGSIGCKQPYNVIDAWFMTSTGPLIASHGTGGCSILEKEGENGKEVPYDKIATQVPDFHTCRHEHLSHGGSVMQRIFRIARGSLNKSRMLQDYLLDMFTYNELTQRYLDKYQQEDLSNLGNFPMASLTASVGDSKDGGGATTIKDLLSRLKEARQQKTGRIGTTCPAGQKQLYYAVTTDSDGNVVSKEYHENPYLCSKDGKTCILNPAITDVECGRVVAKPSESHSIATAGGSALNRATNANFRF